MSTFSNNKVVLLNQANIVAKFFWPWVLLFFYFCTTVHMTSQANLCKYRTKLKNKMILPLSSIHYCSSSIKKLSISPKHKSNIFHKLLLLFCVYFIDCPMVSCSSRHFEKRIQIYCNNRQSGASRFAQRLIELCLSSTRLMLSTRRTWFC